MLAYVGLLLVLVGGIGLGLRLRAKSTEKDRQDVVASGVGSDLITNREVWQGPLPQQLAEAFVKAATDDDRLKLVRHPEQVADSLRSWYRDGPGRTEEVAAVVALVQPVQPPQLNPGAEIEHAHFMVELTDGGRRLLAIMKSPTGGKVDFPCYARQCSAPWSAILGGQVVQADVRAFVAGDLYYNFAYSDDTVWHNLTLTSPDLEGTLHLYVRRDASGLKELLEMPPSQPRRLFLKITHTSPENLAHRQFEVLEILAPDWTT